MRGLLAASVLLLSALAGCSGDAPPQAPATPGEGATGGLDVPGLAGPAADAVRFAAAPYNASVSYVGSLPMPDQCLLSVVVPCSSATQRFDLTAQVPTQAPVDLTVTASSEACLDLTIEVEGATLQRVQTVSFTTQPTLAASVLRSEGGTVAIVVSSCSVFAGDPTNTTAAVHLEASTVVRPAILPMYAPVAIELAAGDRLVADGSGLEALLVGAPGQPLVEVVTPFAYNATGAGRHLVVALGSGDAGLRGVNATMEALPLQTQVGAWRPLASGQATAWDFTVPGIPLVVGVTITAPEGTGGNLVVVAGNVHVRVSSGGQDVLAYDEASPLPSTSLIGGSLYSYAAGYGDLRQATGSFSASVLQEQSVNQVTRDFAAYVVL